MLSSGVVSRHEDGPDYMLRSRPEARFGGTDIAVVLMESESASMFQRLANDVHGIGVSDAIAKGIRSSTPFFWFPVRLCDSAGSRRFYDRSWSERAPDVDPHAFAICEGRELRRNSSAGRADLTAGSVIRPRNIVPQSLQSV